MTGSKKGPGSVKAASAQGGATCHTSAEEVSRPREIGCLLAQPLRHRTGLISPAQQHERANVSVGNGEP